MRGLVLLAGTVKRPRQSGLYFLAHTFVGFRGHKNKTPSCFTYASLCAALLYCFIIQLTFGNASPYVLLLTIVFSRQRSGSAEVASLQGLILSVSYICCSLILQAIVVHVWGGNFMATATGSAWHHLILLEVMFSGVGTTVNSFHGVNNEGFGTISWDRQAAASIWTLFLGTYICGLSGT